MRSERSRRLLFTLAHAAGVGTVPWLVATEAFPHYARAAAVAFLGAAHWSYALDVSAGFRSAAGGSGGGGDGVRGVRAGVRGGTESRGAEGTGDTAGGGRTRVGGGVLEVLPQGGAAAGDAAAASPGAVSGRGTFQTSR